MAAVKSSCMARATASDAAAALRKLPRHVCSDVPTTQARAPNRHFEHAAVQLGTVDLRMLRVEAPWLAAGLTRSRSTASSAAALTCPAQPGSKPKAADASPWASLSL